MTKTGFKEPGTKETTPKPKVGLEIGDTGTRFFSGIIREEYNPKLDGLRGIEVYEEMRRSDGSVQSILQSVKQPLLSAEWRVKPASEKDKDVEIAEFVRMCLFEIQELPYADYFRQALLAFDFGHMVFEKVFAVQKVNGADRIVWAKLAPRMPRSIQKWEITGGKLGITQQTSNNTPAEIPMEKLIVFVNDKEGDNWNGVSLLRSAYKHWYIKSTLEKVDAIAHERQGLGIPYAKLPEGATKSDTNKAEEILKNARANEHAFFIIPEGYEIGFMDMKASTTRDASPSLAYHSREIVKSVLAQYLELTAAGSGGSNALSKDQSSMFLQGVENKARWFCDTMKAAIKELVDLNFAGVEQYPCLDFEGITREDVKGLVDTLVAAKTAGAYTPQDADEDAIREKLGMPELDEAGIRKEEPVDTDPYAVDPKQKAKASTHRHGLKKNFSQFSKYFRTLTFAEQKVDFDKIESKMDELEAGLDQDIKELLHGARADYMAELTRAVHKGDTAAIKEATLKVQAAYTKILKTHMKAAFEYGKTNAAKEIGKEAPTNPKYILDHIDIESDAIAQDHITRIVSASKQALTNATNRGQSVSAALAAADAAAEDVIDTLSRNTTSILTAGYINNARDEIFDRYADDVYALQRSELLDATTCNFCLSFDGRIVENTDSIARTGPVHSNCRGIWVAIMKDEAELPKISGVPKTIRDRIGDTVNDVEQPNKPIVKKGSPAKEEADKRPE